jgi:hypothetical protein
MMRTDHATADLADAVTDTIVLTFPAKPSLRGVPSLVLGGVGTRLDLPYERVDDLQLAVLSMLEASTGDETAVEIQAEAERLAISVGPLRPEAGTDEGLALVLRRLTDGVEAERRGDEVWLTVLLARSPAGEGAKTS